MHDAIVPIVSVISDEASKAVTRLDLKTKKILVAQYFISQDAKGYDRVGFR